MCITNYGEEETLYNSTRKGSTGNNGKNQDQMLFKRPILEVKPNYKTGKVEVHAIVTGVKHHPSKKEVGYPESFNGESVTKFGDVFVCAGAAKSHSSVINPRVYIFDPQSRQIQRVSNTEVNSTALISVPDHGIVIGASYGSDVSDNATPVHMTSMIAIQNVAESRFKNGNKAAGGIEVLNGNQSNPAIGDMWYNTSNNTLVIKVS